MNTIPLIDALGSARRRDPNIHVRASEHLRKLTGTDHLSIPSYLADQSIPEPKREEILSLVLAALSDGTIAATPLPEGMAPIPPQSIKVEVFETYRFTVDVPSTMSEAEWQAHVEQIDTSGMELEFVGRDVKPCTPASP
jgi:hypothetical protein